MADERLQVLIEGYDPTKLPEESKVDQHWKEIIGAYQNRTILQALVTGIESKLDKPCAVIRIGHVRGFIPLEASGTETDEQLHGLRGKLVAFKVLNYDREADVFTASRAAALGQMSELTWKKVKEGQTIIAVARSVSLLRVRADIGGIEVSIPVEEIRYGWVDDLTKEVKPGDHFKVKVLTVNREKGTIKVSAKAAQENPWPDCAERYMEGSEYVGIVSGVPEYGVFVNLEPGVDSLSQHLKFEDAKKGDRVLVRVMDVNVQKEQIRSHITQIL